ncbi:tetratricopeptide repeat protein [Desulfococcaceae bacterium HSG7]|nr:tetratricopeptide repeat protein [Desulfococcaceae bacterium HSG7]
MQSYRLIKLSFFNLIIIISFFWLFGCPALAQNDIAGKVADVKGVVLTLSPNQTEWQPAVAGQSLAPGTTIRTAKNGWAALLMADETLIQLNRNTVFILKEVSPSAGWNRLRKVAKTGRKKSSYRMRSGELWLRTKNKNINLNLKTPTVSASIRGTEINARIKPDETVVLSVLEGQIQAQNDLGTLTAGASEQIIAQPGMALRKQVLISPRDAVQWTISTPSLADHHIIPLISSDYQSLNKEKTALTASLDREPDAVDKLVRLGAVLRDLGKPLEAQARFEQALTHAPDHPDALNGLGWAYLDLGDPEKALAAFNRVKPPPLSTMIGLASVNTLNGEPDKALAILKEARAQFPDVPLLDVQEALVNLQIRDLTRARQVLEEASRKHPDSSEVWSLLSLTALMQDDKKTAVSASQTAAAKVEHSPKALMIQSYVAQSTFDMVRAQDLNAQVLELDNANVYALVNRARLLFGSDDIEGAAAAIAQAHQLAPTDGNVQNLRGFILLAQRKTQDAMAAFKVAVKQNPGMGEPHLGLALIYMRQGDVAAAMQAITQAVLLEPRRSLFLSYWAKMLYQVKRFDRALSVLESAQKLDPNDPTPLVYRAIILRDLNRPTEALEALNQAVELNDNRAVYRSRFMLDRDLAVKNVDQAVIYNQLGLADWAKNKALASVKKDFNNSTGHIFLSGALLNLESRLTAGRSEFMLGTILQPANINSLNSFQEYTSFFEKPDVSGHITMQGGNHDTYGGSTLLRGNMPDFNIAFNLIASYEESDGWRDINNYSRFGIVRGALKWDPTPQDGLFLEARFSNSDAGDEHGLDEYEYDSPTHPLDWNSNRLFEGVVGYHHHFTHDAELLLYYRHQEFDDTELTNRFTWMDSDFLRFARDRGNIELPYDMGQAQYMQRLGAHQLITGTVQRWNKNRLTYTTDQEFYHLYEGDFYFEGASSETIDTDFNEHFQSYYLQDIWEINSELIAEAAFYYDKMENSDSFRQTRWELSEASPRLGMIWTPTSSDTVRFAAFRYLTPFLFDRLDPTDIAGVSVYRTAFPGSVTEEADIVYEHEWSHGFVSVNPFYLESTYTSKLKDNITQETYMSNIVSRLKGAEAAWNQMVFNGLGLRATYRFLDVDNGLSVYKSRLDHLAKFSLNYLHSSGIGAGVSQTFRYLDFDNSIRQYSEEIWVTDLRFSYELPDKQGYIRLELNNITDNEFNWTVDDLVFQGRESGSQIRASVSVYF